MTEFEINKAVAEKAGLRHSVNELVGVVSADKYRDCYFDPCNNIEQAWEIMMKHNICVTKGDDDLYDAFSDLYCVGPTSFCYGFCKSHGKPLVAAMLCFLEL